MNREKNRKNILNIREKFEKIENIYWIFNKMRKTEVYFEQKQMPRPMNIQTENKHVSVAVTTVK